MSRSPRVVLGQVRASLHSDYQLDGLSGSKDDPYPIDLRPYFLRVQERDDRGVVVTGRPNGGSYHNPVAIALHALAVHAEWFRTGEPAHLKSLRAQVLHLLRTQDERGGWLYPVPVRRYGIEPGWYSGMAQGLALSVFARAHGLAPTEDLRSATVRAFDLLARSVADGGCSSAGARGLFPEECAVDPPAHILNGGAFAILSAWEVRHEIGEAYAASCLAQLEAMLPAYDLGYWSRYDLRFRVPATPAYHALHVAQLASLGSLAQRPALTEWSRRWAALRGRRNTLRALVVRSSFALTHPA
jgi:hypothetical protein